MESGIALATGLTVAKTRVLRPTHQIPESEYRVSERSLVTPTESRNGRDSKIDYRFKSNSSMSIQLMSEIPRHAALC